MPTIPTDLSGPAPWILRGAKTVMPAQRRGAATFGFWCEKGGLMTSFASLVQFFIAKTMDMAENGENETFSRRDLGWDLEGKLGL
jgi:hypothetical protein